jgi:hypothetical protein
VSVTATQSGATVVRSVGADAVAAGALPRTGNDHLTVAIAIAVALSCLGAITLLATRRHVHQTGHRNR